MSVLVRHVALVSESDKVAVGDVMRVAAALQKQAVRDLAPIWEISATVDAFERLEHVPVGYWPMIVRDDIGQPGAAGVHLDNNRQPFALISASGNLNEWSLTASHEAIEMLVDPFGDRLMAGDSPAEGQSRVEFLVEACDPSEDASFAYTVNEIVVSDFYTPRYFDPVAAEGARYSFTNAITRPREVLKGGYLSWHDPVSDHWFQLTYFEAAPKVDDIGKMDPKSGSLRSQIDRLTEEKRQKAAGPKAAATQVSTGRLAAAAGAMSHASSAVADRLRSQIESIVGSSGSEAVLKRPRSSIASRHALKSGPKFPVNAKS